MLRKDDHIGYFKTINEAQGVVETLFSVTGAKDRQGDVVLPGAFRKALAGRKPTLVFAHKWDDIGQVLGSVKDWAEYMPGDTRLPDNIRAAGYGAAWARVQFNMNTDAGRTAFELVRSGDLKEWSWAFDIEKGGEEYDQNRSARMIKSVAEIYELTLCVVGANQLTQTTSTKLSGKALDDLETDLIIAAGRVIIEEMQKQESRTRDRREWGYINNYIASLNGR